MIISQTPIRISLSGGGTDLKEYYSVKGGLVVSTAIDKYLFVVVKERFDDLIYVNYTKKEIVNNWDEVQHELVREAAKITGMPSGVEITMLADIPSEGSGLGSSSSLTVGLLNAFYNYQGLQVTSEKLASEACKIEIDILNKPIGKQDQFIAAYGGVRSIIFNEDDSVNVRKVKISGDLLRRLGANLLLFYTNVTRKSASILTEQKSNVNRNIEFHDEIKELGLKLLYSLETGNIDEVGKLLHQNWMAKKKLSSNITNDEIDVMYEKSVRGGAIGGKIAGAGGGGFLLSYCRREKQDDLRYAMRDFKELPFMLEPHGSKIIFDYRRYNWK